MNKIDMASSILAGTCSLCKDPYGELYYCYNEIETIVAGAASRLPNTPSTEVKIKHNICKFCWGNIIDEWNTDANPSFTSYLEEQGIGKIVKINWPDYEN